MFIRFLLLLALVFAYIFSMIGIATSRPRGEIAVSNEAPPTPKTDRFKELLHRLDAVRSVVADARVDSRLVDSDDASREVVRTTEVAHVEALTEYARFSAALIEAIETDEISCVPITPSFARHTSKIVIPNANPFGEKIGLAMLGDAVISQPNIIYNNNVLLEILQRYMHMFESKVSELVFSLSTRGAQRQSAIEKMLTPITEQMRDFQPRLFLVCADQKKRLAEHPAVHPSLYSYEFKSDSIHQAGEKMPRLLYGLSDAKIGLKPQTGIETNIIMPVSLDESPTSFAEA